MTRLRNDPKNVSNYFDKLERGVGHRGSSFTDVDRLCWTHDKITDRFLFRELKKFGEKPMKEAGQGWALRALAHTPGFTVWGGRELGDDRILFKDFATGHQEVISGDEWKVRVESWWDGLLA